MYGKRGQGGVDIASLLILITLFIFLYMVMIPVEEREELLGTSSIDSNNRWYDGDGLEDSGEKVLLSVSPGEVYEFDKDEIDKEIFPVALFSKVDEEYLDLIKNLDMGFRSRTLTFRVPDEEVRDLKLFFLIPESGKLKIKFNNLVVFNGNVDSGDVPIDLPVSYIKAVNSLTFEKGLFSGVKLSDIKLRMGMLKENVEARRSFVLTDGEKEGMKKAELNFFINCLSLEERGNLRITLNDRLLRDDIVFCDILDTSIDINKDYLKEGLNILNFEIDRGDYKLENIELILEVTQKDYPKYEFEVEDDDYGDLDYGCSNRDCLNDCEEECDWDCETSGCFNRCLDDCEEECEEDCDNKIILEMSFGKDEKKKASITINEDQFTINTNENRYKRDITEMVNRGANFVKIIPKIDFEIEILKIYIRE